MASGDPATATRPAREHGSHFDTNAKAQRWLNQETAAIVTNQYVDPRSGRVIFREYGEHCAALRCIARAPRTIERQLRHAYPVLGDRPMSSIKPSDIQAWVKRLTEHLQPSLGGVVHRVVPGIFRAAVRDTLIVHNPCDGTKLPKSRVEPLDTEVVHALAAAVPDRYRATTHDSQQPSVIPGAAQAGRIRALDPAADCGLSMRQGSRRTGRYRLHELRHYYASLLIRRGEIVEVVQARLGHASASETLDTYSDLWPDSDDRTRRAVDSVILADSVRTGDGSMDIIPNQVGLADESVGKPDSVCPSL